MIKLSDWLRESLQSHLAVRIATAVSLIAVLLSILKLPGLWFVAGLSVLILALAEWMQLLKISPAVKYMAFIAMLMNIWAAKSYYSGFPRPGLETGYLVLIFTLILWIAELLRLALQPQAWLPSQRVKLYGSIIGWLILSGLGWSVFEIGQILRIQSASLRLFPASVRWLHTNALLSLVCCLCAGDSAALFIGQYLGKTQLAPTISPKKTWEGWLGGLLFSVLTGILYFVITCKWYSVTPNSTNFQWVVFAALLSYLGASLGDLYESSWKRHMQVKHSSQLLPGHGGCLDRLDSFWLSVPLLALYCKTTLNV